MSIRVRLTAWYTGIMALSVVALGLVLYALYANSLWARAEDALRTRAEQIAMKVEPTDPQDRSDPVGALVKVESPSLLERLSAAGMMIQISDTAGSVVGRSSSPGSDRIPLGPAVRRALGGRELFERTVVADVGPVLLYTSPVTHRGSIIGALQVATPVESIEEPLDRLRWLLLFLGAGALVVAAVGGHLLAVLTLAPIDRITKTARAIGTGSLGRRLHLRGANDEVRRLAQAFDEMLDRIDGTLERERQFTANVAHELRTPLTILKGELEVALRRERPPGVYRAAMASMKQEVDRLVRLVEDLLILARADAGVLRLDLRATAVDTMVRWAEGQFRAAAGEKAVALAVEGTESLHVLGDLDWLRQVFTNLLDNAIRYTPAGGTIRLTWDRDGAFARVRVIDTGCGIAVEDLPHLFDRFYRANRVRAQASGGSGLGLAIAQSIAKAHGGRIDIESRIGSGTTVTVWLPLADAVETEPAPGGH
ncbi:MAG TPA: ATP-binding protein [bacterium]|nr:ATP-binding protein [bacterium]